MAGLTTHVLDTANGIPAVDMTIELWRLDDEQAPIKIKSVATNGDGRTDGPLLIAAEMASGAFELRFHVAEYFRANNTPLTDPPFLDVVPIRFAVADAGQHYHVPLLVSPWSYSTYRGS